MSALRERSWADVLADHAAEEATRARLVAQLGACEAAALAFCRLLERWARGDAAPSTPGQREAALRHAADRAETALTGLEKPLYLELAIFVRALQGLGDAARIDARLDRSSLWAGLFDLRENLLGRAVEDLRALAA